MRMRLELLDTWRRRAATFSDMERLAAIRRGPDRYDALDCVVPHVSGIGPGCLADLYIEGDLWRRFEILGATATWDGDIQIEHNELAPLRDRMRITARSETRAGNTRITRAYVNTTGAEALSDSIHRAPGALHYHVGHEAYPEGAAREYVKFLERATPDNALEVGGISRGQWVGADRIDASAAWAKDGDTIAGMVVDGVAWPELRLMMIDAEETSLNNHARKRHPETTLWTSERYARSGYKLRADAATAFLAQLLQEKGVSHIELNPHRGSSGAFDDRVDAYGRYIAQVFGGGECFNAALVETGHADIYLYEDGRYHVPEHRLKDYYSYLSVNTPDLAEDSVPIEALDLDCGALEAIEALTLIEGNRVFTVSPELNVKFHDADAPAHVLAYRAERMRLRTGFRKRPMVNWLALRGNSRVAPDGFTRFRGDSIGAYGLEAGRLECEWAGASAELEGLSEHLLEDMAYPTPDVELTFFDGAPEVFPGQLIKIEGAPLARHARRLETEWGDRYGDAIVGRVAEVAHRIEGARVETTVLLTSPLRSVTNPYRFIRRICTDRKAMFAMRLDDAMVGLDQERFYLS